MKKIIDRLNEYIEIKGISLNAFDKSVGASNGYIGKQIKSRGSIGGDIIEKISCTYEDLNIEWLITGRGEMTYRESPSFETNKVARSTCQICEIKDLLIESQKQQILALTRIIDHIEEKKSPDEGQKRKAVS